MKQDLKNNRMKDEYLSSLDKHVAVHLENCILVIAGGLLEEDHFCEWHKYWLYDLYTDHWRTYKIPHSASSPCIIDGQKAVIIGTDVYMFGGTTSSAVWQVSRQEKDYFTWKKMPETARSEMPSPRYGHTAWEYGEKMCVFGGEVVLSYLGYLNQHGDIEGDSNNQLFCFDACHNTWTNPKCSGDVPSPRYDHATAVIGETVWLYGGYNHKFLGDFYTMSMGSFSWTQIKINDPTPRGRCEHSLTATSATQLVLHGGLGCSKQLNVTWVFDIEARVWRRYTQDEDHRCEHTGLKGLTSSVICIGGSCINWFLPNIAKAFFHLMLEPRSLKAVAMQMIHKHKDVLQWKSLPNKLGKLLTSST